MNFRANSLDYALQSIIGFFFSKGIFYLLCHVSVTWVKGKMLTGQSSLQNELYLLKSSSKFYDTEVY